MILWCAGETSPSHSAGQGGGADWSAKTGHPTVVMDRFHQGAYGLTGKMQTVAAARGTDIYLSGAPALRTRGDRVKKTWRFRRREPRRAAILGLAIELHARSARSVVRAKSSVSKKPALSARKHIFIQHDSLQHITAII